MDDLELNRWRGMVDAFMNQSAADRGALHTLMDKIIERSDRRHEELLEEIRQSNHATRNAIQALTTAIGVQERRIDAWEQRAQGASWVVKLIPHSITVAATSLFWWLVTGGKSLGPPGGQ